ncbi:hypothetical protein HHO41_09960 [Bacillus sp. DNRA2]|uniref:hypothetical protein n=1 Tax=Bacillus sp. DNRA2 TaxID=2723053 RepID=UPI00145F4C2B|nr:hypothetical protein [Bacillus sp. DNRA2]NMD70616.1 hypothetical protein [Bacillus sp. DNRA2]
MFDSLGYPIRRLWSFEQLYRSQFPLMSYCTATKTLESLATANVGAIPFDEKKTDKTEHILHGKRGFQETVERAINVQ